MSHYFFAIKLPVHVKQYLQSVKEKMSNEIPFEKWVHQEDYHITLAFLGHAADIKLKKALELCRKELADTEELKLEISGLGTFGRTKAPRILWAGTEKTAPLLSLQKVVHSACEHAGFSLETRTFAPHITIARKWGSETLFDQSLIDGKIGHYPFMADEVVLYQTYPGQIPAYRVVESIRLTKTGFLNN